MASMEFVVFEITANSKKRTIIYIHRRYRQIITEVQDKQISILLLFFFFYSKCVYNKIQDFKMLKGHNIIIVIHVCKVV